MKSLSRLLLLLASLAVLTAAPVSLFDGKTLNGWEGETTKVWRVEDGVIVGGSFAGNPRNEFLVTKQKYFNFRLKLEYKLVGTEGFVNGGVQFRSVRIAKPDNEMSGYQADIGAGYSGGLYDESRRKKFLAQADKEMVAKIEKPGDWNTYEILAEGPRVQIFLNGKRTVDYSETDPNIDDSYGYIGLQIHGNNKAQVYYRNITIDTLSEGLVPPRDQILRRFGEPDAPKPELKPFKEGRFEVGDAETVVLVGQENFVREAKSGDLEARLLSAYKAKQPKIRSMAWEGDTVYDQWRDLNFGPWKGQLDSVGATTVIVQFGQMEALEGPAQLARFTSAYHRLLDEFAQRTPRLVLVSPMPFEKPVASHAPDLTKRNADVAAYAAAIRDIARQRGAVYVDLFGPLSARKDAVRLTDNGIHLNAEGLRVVAEVTAAQLGAAGAAPSGPLLAAVAEKNRLWADCWRPANWSFVYGDRITQNYGKASVIAPSLRENFEAHKPLVAKWDAYIQAIVNGDTTAKAPAPEVAKVQTEPLQSSAEEQASFKVADGFQVNLFADEKLGVAKPTQFAWDEKGRLFVACSSTYPQTIPGVKPSDYILILEDTDGDGVADKSTRFAEGLTMVQGVEPANGGIYVCDFDQILFLKDTDGDGKADQRTVVLAGFGIGDTHQLVNSIMHGPDGSLWFSQGLHAVSRVETPNGVVKLPKSGLWRFTPRTQRLQSFFQYGKAGHNCWGVVFDDYNQPFHKSGDRVAGYWSQPGLGSIDTPDEYDPVGPLFLTELKSNSIDIIGTKAMPASLQGCAVIGGYFGNFLDAYRFSDFGAGYKTEELPKLIRSSSKAFRPVDVSVGPDGAIYAADWFNPVIGHYQSSYADPRRDRSHGRIWRVTAKGLPSVKAPNLAAMNAAELVEQLHSEERWNRYQAKRLLFYRDAAEVAAAADAAVARSQDERFLLEVTGVFQAHQLVRPALLDRLLNAKDFRVRAYGARVAAEWASQLPNALELLAKSVADEEPRVRLEAVVGLSYIPRLESAEVAVRALDKPVDRFIDYSLRQTVRSLQPVWQAPLKANQLPADLKPAHVAYLKKVLASGPAVVSPGQAIYEGLCLNCHQASGQGLAGVYPPLAGSEWVVSDKAKLIKIVTQGLSGPTKVLGKDYGLVPMPPMGLDDQQAADVLTYVRKTFGENASAITAEEVKAVRAKNAGRTAPWTAEDLSR